MKAIMVMFDSLNRHMLPPYGCDWVQAPNFQRLADRSVVFDNCYVGFIYMDPEGNRQFTLNSYEDSFDWKQDSLQLNLSEQCASGVQFIIFMSKSGTLWIDDVVFSER